MSKKGNNRFIIIWTIACSILAMCFFAYIMYSYHIGIGNIILSLAKLSIIGIVILTVACTFQKNAEIVNKIFKLEIMYKNDTSKHLRITDSNLFCIYEQVTLYRRNLFTKPLAHGIKNKFRVKKQLTVDEAKDIIERISNLEENPANELIANIRWIKKCVSEYEVNKIFSMHNIIIRW